MSFAKNRVIAGDYKGDGVSALVGQVYISSSPGASLLLSSDTVDSYELITPELIKKAASGADSGIMGDAFPELVETLSEAITADNDRTQYLAVLFKDGKKSLLELDRDVCKLLIKNSTARPAVKCGVTPDIIGACTPRSERECRVCPCYKCVLRPNCCFRVMHDRRAKDREMIKKKTG